MDALSSRLIVGQGTPEARWQAWFDAAPLAMLPFARLVRERPAVYVVAPHPDDEILGCAGIMRQAARLDIPIHVIAVTDGEASHPGSSLWPRDLLRRAREGESAAALDRLAVAAARQRLEIPDGEVAAHEAGLARRLAGLFAPHSLVIAPWRLDGHPDHEATGRASRQAARDRGCRFLEVPIWGWHWADPASGVVPRRRAIAIPLGVDDQQAKARAIQAFQSQLAPDPTTGQGPILPSFALARLQRPFEVVLR